MAQQEDGGQSAGRSAMGFFTSAKGAVLTVGALAGAIGSVLALLPKDMSHPPSALKASFGKVTVYPDVGLEEYEARFGTHAVAKVEGPPSHAPSAVAVPYRLMGATSSISSSSDPPPSAEESTTSTSESTPVGEQTSTSTSTSTRPSTSTTKTTHSRSSTSTSTSDTSTTDTTSGGGNTEKFPKPPPASTPFNEVDGALIREGTGAPPQQVHATVEALLAVNLPEREVMAATSPRGATAKLAVPSACKSSSCAVTPMIDHELTYDPDPIKAARAVARVFAHSRGRVIDHRLYPRGAAVYYSVDLHGFAHREAVLEWSLWSKAGRPLPPSWLHNVIVREVQGKQDEEPISNHFWIPSPPRRGDYVVHLTLLDSNGVEYGEAETEPPFH